MAFRSPLDAANERADAAESEVRRLTDELAAQRARMDRVGEVESELESARARLRTAAPQSFLEAGGLWIGAAFVLGAGLAYGYQETRIAAERDVSAATELGHARERRAAAATAEAVRSELTTNLSVCEDRLRAEADEHEELRSYFDELSARRAGPTTVGAAGALLEVGRVVRVSGTPPVSVGASCSMGFSGVEPGCSGELRCGGVVVHRLGCDGRGSTEMHHRGLGMDITDGGAGWTVSIAQSLGPR